MTPPAPVREVLGAGSPLTRAVFTEPPRPGLVLASFPTALYLSVGEHHEVLPVLASDALMLPTGTRLSAPGREVVWGVEPGDTVTVGRSGIHLPHWQLRVVREWRPARIHAVSTLPEPGLLSETAELLSCQAHSPELVDQAAAVCRAARCGDDVTLRGGVRLLLGAGPGLTPSGDDVLCAVLLVLVGVGDPAPIALLGRAVQNRWSATTSLSASLLDAARGGFAVPEVAALVRCSLRGDLVGSRDALTATLAIGHWSGPDLVSGLIGCLRVLAELPPRVRLPSLAFRPERRLQTAERESP